MHKLKDNIKGKLYDIEEKVERNPKAEMSLQELQKVQLMSDIVKNIDKIEALEGEEGGYSEASNWMGEGRMYGNSYEGGTSYRRGRMRAKRDLMGRYSRESGYSETSYGRGDTGNSYASNYGSNSYGGAKDHMLDQLEEMMEQASSEKERKAIEHCIKQIESV
jgi:hypothetical protein